jgi:hypothetical protein
MMTGFIRLAGLLGWVWLLAAPVVAQDTVPTAFAREYKVMLTPALFVYQNEAAAVAALMAEVEQTIERETGRKVRAKPALKKQRVVRFYDVAGRCTLRNSGYVLRAREDNAQTELTLKYRAADAQQVLSHAMHPLAPNAHSKLEADIGAQPGVPFKAVYSHSVGLVDVALPTHWQAINGLFAGFTMAQAEAGNTPLALVGDLVIYERVYKNVKVDLGKPQAQMSLTLWYQGAPTADQSPFIAELSFKLDAQGQSASPNVIERAEQVFFTLQSLSAVSMGAATKTARVYQFQPGFCQNADEQ